jgi:mannose-1-phosphate guanylyltransferase/mannose-6-phosphate isomerase
MKVTTKHTKELKLCLHVLHALRGKSFSGRIKMTDSIESLIPTEMPNVGVVERPWGAFRQYAYNEPVTVSLMRVKPGQRLSLQSHEGRAELWIVLDDGAAVQIGDEELYPEAGAELWIPAGARHRLSSTHVPTAEGEAEGGPVVRVLEVAFGNWQQADIRRYDDDYDRPQQGE